MLGKPHQDCIHTFLVNGFTLRNTKIHGCEHFGILAGSDQMTPSSPARRLVIENNFFWDSGIADIRPRGDLRSRDRAVRRVTVRNNCTENDLIGDATYHNAIWQNNVLQDGRELVVGHHLRRQREPVR